MADWGGLENRCGPQGPPWVRIPPPPLHVQIRDTKNLTIDPVRFFLTLMIGSGVDSIPGSLITSTTDAQDKGHGKQPCANQQNNERLPDQWVKDRGNYPGSAFDDLVVKQ